MIYSNVDLQVSYRKKIRHVCGWCTPSQMEYTGLGVRDSVGTPLEYILGLLRPWVHSSRHN